jgi:hypothetical protein
MLHRLSCPKFRRLAPFEQFRNNKYQITTPVSASQVPFLRTLARGCVHHEHGFFSAEPSVIHWSAGHRASDPIADHQTLRLGGERQKITR